MIDDNLSTIGPFELTADSISLNGNNPVRPVFYRPEHGDVVRMITNDAEPTQPVSFENFQQMIVDIQISGLEVAHYSVEVLTVNGVDNLYLSTQYISGINISIDDQLAEHLSTISDEELSQFTLTTADFLDKLTQYHYQRYTNNLDRVWDLSPRQFVFDMQDFQYKLVDLDYNVKSGTDITQKFYVKSFMASLDAQINNLDKVFVTEFHLRNIRIPNGTIFHKSHETINQFKALLH